MALVRAFGGLLVESGVKLVWLASPAYATDRRPALPKSDEATIRAAAEHIVNSAPLVGVGRSAG
jgi:hypothetical protein